MSKPATPLISEPDARGIPRGIFALSQGKSVDPRVWEKPKSTQNYHLCFTARSGSTMLCSLLGKTGLLGHPEEYVNPRGPMQMFLQRLPATNVQGYFDAIRRVYATPNGVFGMKSAHLDFAPLHEEGRVDELLSPLVLVYLTRRDIVAQAVSLVLAMETGRWHKMKNQTVPDTRAPASIPYNEAAVQRQIELLHRAQDWWENFFLSRAQEPLRLVYEDMLEDIPGTVARIAQHVGIPMKSELPVAQPTTARLSDDTNRTWVERFRNDHEV